jgi:hypothetical protein
MRRSRGLHARLFILDSAREWALTHSARVRYATLFGGERWVANGGWLDFIRSAETLEEALPRTEEAVWWEVFDLRRGKAVATSIARREEHLRERGLWAGEEGQRDDPGRG